MRKFTLLVALLVSNFMFAQYQFWYGYGEHDFIDISSTGTALNLDDDETVTVSVPFTVYLGSQGSTDIRVGNNGAILFGTTGFVSSSNSELSTSNPMIAPLWDDLDSEVGNVYYETTGTAPNRKFIVQWERVFYMNGTNTNTDPISFQVRFDEKKRDIIFAYDDLDADGTEHDRGATATIGIATSAEVNQISFNTALDGDIWLFTGESTLYTYVPDNNFEHYLETHKADGTVVSVGDAQSMGNGVDYDYHVYTSRINNENVTNLDVSNLGIADLTGIDDFDHLTSLNCSHNNLSEMNSLGNGGIVTLNCSYNNLTTLDNFGYYYDLSDVNCSHNNLLYISEIDNLNGSYTLDCSYNNLPTLNVSGNSTSTTVVYATNNPNLTCIFVDDVNDLPAISKDASTHYVETNAECEAYYTAVPDDNFENYLETHDASGTEVDFGDPSSMGNAIANDDYVRTTRINNVTDLGISGKNITTIEGIEDFSSIINLDCTNNNISSITFTSTSLDNLYCGSNNLTELDLSQFPYLLRLDCSSNDITVLDTSGNQNLNELSCSENKLRYVDLSSNLYLTALECDGNLELTTLNVRNANNSYLDNLTAIDNPLLTCVFVDNASDANAGINDYVNWGIDATATYLESQSECDAIYTTTVPDDNFESYLETHKADGSDVALGSPYSMGNGVLNDNTVPTSRIEHVLELNVSHNNISELTGIEDFVALNKLLCNGNRLTTLDLSNNTDLKELDCEYNSYGATATLTDLDISNCTKLTDLNCGENNLTQLNLTNNSLLVNLDCSDNHLEVLDISNLSELEELLCYNNSLTELNTDTLASLSQVFCYNNQIVELDLSTNHLIKSLYCANNNLTTLNLKGIYFDSISYTVSVDAQYNPELTCVFVDDATSAAAGTGNYTDFYIDATATYLEFQSECDAIYTTTIPDDNFEAYLETHDANNNTVALGAEASLGNGVLNDNTVPTFGIEHVELLSIINEDIADLTGIENFRDMHTLYCQSNNLMNLDISNNEKLVYLDCFSNSLTSLNAKNGFNNILHEVDATNNPDLTCIFVDNASDANAGINDYVEWNKDATATYLETQAECDALLGYEDLTKIEFELYPNPTNTTFAINTLENVINVKLFDYLGREVAHFNKQDSYNVSNLHEGVYFVSIITENSYGTKKIIINK